MTLPTIFAMAGCIALLAGLFGGGITIKDIVIPKIAHIARISSTIFGIVLIGLAVSISLSPASASQQPTDIPTSFPPLTTSVSSKPSIASETSSLISWAIDPAGVCRDDAGGYPRWSEYTWSLSQCQEACKNNSNCQGFAMSKQMDYCQLFGSDGGQESSDPGNPGAQITHGDSSQSQYTCYIKKH